MAQLELGPLAWTPSISSQPPLTSSLEAFPSLEISLLWNTLNQFSTRRRGISHPYKQEARIGEIIIEGFLGRS